MSGIIRRVHNTTFFPAGEFFEYRWLTIDGRQAHNLFQGLGIRAGVHYAGECPGALFNKLELEISFPERKRRLAALSLAFSILTLAVSGTKRTTRRKGCAEEARLMIDEDFSDPELNIERIAELLHVNRVSLSRSFSRLYGTLHIRLPERASDSGCSGVSEKYGTFHCGNRRDVRFLLCILFFPV